MLISEQLASTTPFLRDVYTKMFSAAPFEAKYIVYFKGTIAETFANRMAEVKDIEEEMLVWCKTNMKHGCYFIEDINYMLFEDEHDAAIWKLRWG